jgi:BirA family biotin operon repressor/biotin-[acetyl-CoA-carboxylase] ligase
LSRVATLDAAALIRLDAVDSTNREALRRIEAGAPHGTVIQADRQTEGRGRRGRSWISPPGNLYATLIVRSGDGPPVGQLGFVAAIAAGDALRPHAAVRFKWPNDLMLERRKLGGILIETVAGAAAVGIGINVASAPDDTETPATHLASCVTPEVLLDGIRARFEVWHRRWLDDGFSPLREEWLRHAIGLGESIRARLARETVDGVFHGLDADGGLLLDCADGRRRVIAAGDVFLGTT